MTKSRTQQQHESVKTNSIALRMREAGYDLDDTLERWGATTLLGCGVYGCAWSLGPNKVLKVTTDELDAWAATALLNLVNDPYGKRYVTAVAIPYGVWTASHDTAEGYGQRVALGPFVLEVEKLEPILDFGEATGFKRTERSDWIGTLTTHCVGPRMLRELHETILKYPVAGEKEHLELILDEYTRTIRPELRAGQEKKDFLFKLAVLAAKVLYLWIFEEIKLIHDLHPQNLGWSNDKKHIKILDFGQSHVTEKWRAKEIALLKKNPWTWGRNPHRFGGRRYDIKGILRDPILRREMMIETIIATQAREGIDTTWDQAAAAYDAAQMYWEKKKRSPKKKRRRR